MIVFEETERTAEKDRVSFSVELAVKPSPLLSCSPQPLFPCWNTPAASFRTHHKHSIKTKAGSSAQLCLCLSLSLQLLSSRVASNVSDKRPSANPPREISALTSLMLCSALFCSADSPRSVAVLPKGSLRSQEVQQHHHPAPLHLTATHAMVTVYLK